MRVMGLHGKVRKVEREGRCDMILSRSQKIKYIANAFILKEYILRSCLTAQGNK